MQIQMSILQAVVFVTVQQKATDWKTKESETHSPREVGTSLILSVHFRGPSGLTVPKMCHEVFFPARIETAVWH
jgi:hypothetical protein